VTYAVTIEVHAPILPPHLLGEGVEGLGEVVDAVGQGGEGELFAVAGPVGVDDRPQVAVAIAGGPGDPADLGDGDEGDVAAVGEELFVHQEPRCFSVLSRPHATL